MAEYSKAGQGKRDLELEVLQLNGNGKIYSKCSNSAVRIIMK